MGSLFFDIAAGREHRRLVWWRDSRRSRYCRRRVRCVPSARVERSGGSQRPGYGRTELQGVVGGGRRVGRRGCYAVLTAGREAAECLRSWEIAKPVRAKRRLVARSLRHDLGDRGCLSGAVTAHASRVGIVNRTVEAAIHAEMLARIERRVRIDPGLRKGWSVRI